MTATEWGLVVALSILWGGSFFFNGVAVQELPTFTVVVARVAIAGAILLIVLRVVGVALPLDLAAWQAFLAMGLLNNVVPFSLIVWGQHHVASGVASILNATTPLFGVVVAHLLTADEKATGARFLGVVVGFFGVALMMGVDVLAGLGSTALGQLACLGAALSYAFAGVYGRRFRRLGIPPLATATGQVLASSAVLVPLMLLVDRPWTLPMPSAATIGALLGVAALSTALAYVLYFRILATAGATNLLLVTLLIPVSAVLLGVALLDERLGPEHLGGMALIALGLAVIDGRPWRWLRRRAPVAAEP
ncbi:MAG: EamA family transporter [Pseudomonadota bacterium]